MVSCRQKMLCCATLFVLAGFLCTAKALQLPPKSTWTVSASATQEELYAPSNACDGRVDTRWSSPATDPQWLQIDLGAESTVCGVALQWETAFASSYSVRLSTNGSSWRTVFETTEGNGKTDYIDFAPATCRFVRIEGTRRATGWGYSILEIDLRGADEAIAITTSDGLPAPELLDGDPATAWSGGAALPCDIVIDQRQVRGWGGVRIDWGTNWACDVEVAASHDGKAWHRTAGTQEASAPFDVLLQGAMNCRYVRIRLDRPAQPGPVEIRELSFRGPDEPMTDLAVYQLAAKKARPGLYPEHLLGRQVYWTIVGLPNDDKESLFDEYGNVEFAKGGCSVMPYLYMGTGVVSALDAQATQTLASGWMPLPRVSWKAGDVGMEIDAQTSGQPGDAVTSVRYTVANHAATTATGSLFLAIRPVQINPPWQYGGLSPIKSMALDGHVVRINGAGGLVLGTEPTAFGARPFLNGDVMREVQAGVVPKDRAIESTEELVSGAAQFAFHLEPGATTSIVIAAPLHRSVSESEALRRVDFAADRPALEELWRREVARVEIHLPDKALADTMRSQLAYILVNRDGSAIQPGSRQYERSWIRDGGLIVPVLLRMGRADLVRDFLDWYQHFITPEGSVPPSFRADDPLDCGPGSGIEYDGQGFYIHAVLQYFRFTKDRELLDRHAAKVKRALDYLVTLRERTLVEGYYAGEPEPERFRGILPKSFSHEGYYPEMHSYWDDFSGLMAWKDGAEIAQIMGNDEERASALAEYTKLRESVRDSIARTIALKNIDYIPGCAEKGDYDPASTAIAFDPCDETAILPEAILRRTFQRYFSDVTARLTTDWRGNCTPYEARCIGALIGLQEYEKAQSLLDAFMAWRRPPAWNHWGEVILGDPRVGSYIGDMPHSWGGAGVVHAALSMIVKEQGGRLVLLEGAPRSWLADGDGLTIAAMPTWYGTSTMSARLDGGRFVVELDGATPPDGYKVFWPFPTKPRYLRVDDASWEDFDNASCTVPAGTRRIVADW